MGGALWPDNTRNLGPRPRPEPRSGAVCLAPPLLPRHAAPKRRPETVRELRSRTPLEAPHRGQRHQPPPALTVQQDGERDPGGGQPD